ncbi:ImuA family protein [Devosia chinhatensis]|uniref:ImuA family protein n=1 Tax=Devosia chinhatensis TaxID=429727 RepID=UPI0006989906|nr:hypothetical protein [Devosia chinhatensis]
MQAPNHQERLTALRDVIADIERKPALLEAARRSDLNDKGDFPVLPGGLVQEIFADDLRMGGASLGFALTQAKGLLTPKRPVVFYLCLAEDGQRQGMPYGPGLSWFGLDPARLVIIQAGDMTELLWAAEEVMACRAVAALVAEIRGEPKLLNFTASRRLSLRSASSHVSLFLLRYGHGRASSAGHLRWHVQPQRSGRLAHDDRAPGASRWHVQLEKGRIAGNRTQWVLEWTKNGFATLSQPASERRPASPVPGSLSAVLGHGLSQAG